MVLPGVGQRDRAAREVQPSLPRRPRPAQRAVSAEQRPGGDPGERGGDRVQRGRGERRPGGGGGVHPQDVVQSAHQFAGACGEHSQGSLGVPGREQGLDPPGESGEPQPGVFADAHHAQRSGRWFDVFPPHPVGPQVCPPQHDERRRDVGEAPPVLVRVQQFARPQPRRAVAAQILDQGGRVQRLQDVEQSPPDWSGQTLQPQPPGGGRQQVGLGAGPRPEQAQHVGRGVDPFGEHRQRVRSTAAQQGGEHGGLGLPDRDLRGQPLRQVRRRVGEQRGQVIAVLRGERGAAGEQPVQLAHRGGDLVGGDQSQWTHRLLAAELLGSLPTDPVVLGQVGAGVQGRPAGRTAFAPALGRQPVETAGAEQVRAGRERADPGLGAATSAVGARLPGLVEQERPDLPGEEQLRVVGHGVGEAAEQRHVFPVRAEQVVDPGEQPVPGLSQPRRRQPGQCRAQFTGEQVSAPRQIGVQRHQAAGAPRVGVGEEAAGGHTDGAAPAEEEGTEIEVDIAVEGSRDGSGHAEGPPRTWQRG